MRWRNNAKSPISTHIAPTFRTSCYTCTVVRHNGATPSVSYTNRNQMTRNSIKFYLMRYIDPLVEDEEYELWCQVLHVVGGSWRHIQMYASHAIGLIYKGEMAARKPSSPRWCCVWDTALCWLSAVHITTSIRKLILWSGSSESNLSFWPFRPRYPSESSSISCSQSTLNTLQLREILSGNYCELINSKISLPLQKLPHCPLL